MYSRCCARVAVVKSFNTDSFSHPADRACAQAKKQLPRRCVDTWAAAARCVDPPSVRGQVRAFDAICILAAAPAWRS